MHERIPAQTDAIAAAVVDAAYQVHVELGAGLLESIYQRCLIYVLRQEGHAVRSEVEVPLRFRGRDLGTAFRVDLWVDDAVLVELKACSDLAPIHTAQLLTYMKVTGTRLGLLINFNVTRIKDGIRRVAL